MKKRVFSKVLILLLITCMTMGLLASCGKGPVGFWKIDEASAGDVVMTKDDAGSLGLNAIGTVKLQKSGNCEVTMLGETSAGTWEQAEDGTITISYGEDNKLSGTIGEDGIMSLADEHGSAYKLSK